MIEKSAKQKQREAARRPDKEARERAAAEAGAERTKVKIYKGEPGRPAGEVTTFVKPRRKAPSGLRLTAAQRKEIFHGTHPRIACPRWTPRRRKEKPCPVVTGEVRELSSQVSIVITGITPTLTEYELHYAVIDERPRLLRRAVHAQDFDAIRRDLREAEPLNEETTRIAAQDSAYTTSPISALPHEPEAVTEAEQQEMTREKHEDLVKRLKAHHRRLVDQEREMQGEGIFARARWGVRRAIQDLDKRIEFVQGQLADEAREAA